MCLAKGEVEVYKYKLMVVADFLCATMIVMTVMKKMNGCVNAITEKKHRTDVTDILIIFLHGRLQRRYRNNAI